MKVNEWLTRIETKVRTAKAAGLPTGACMLTDANGEPPVCVELDQNTCTSLGGTFLGGDCG
jgi:hypothetical protein